MDLIRLQAILATIWVVWFFVLFVGMLIYVMRPSRRRQYQALADIPLRDGAGQAVRSRRAAGPERESARPSYAGSI
jgi:cbb3-type cytochrome oxidase subunit 3